ncbi:hypothetical protein SLEP1_g50240 [Rubroshorea leprosula]|uniref:Uncharacterized protein n=1 Tax=Rubroshorea leprosula TaxID=152421 RepID=A0AAV5LZD2_9ROSI|nr:hypothetical protein SLEP1_g50240 [Rubroshorea leprosula]
MVSECEYDKFRALCICGTHLTSARRLSRLEIGFWGVTSMLEPPCAPHSNDPSESVGFWVPFW